VGQRCFRLRVREPAAHCERLCALVYLLVELAFGLLGFFVGRFVVLVVPVAVWAVVGAGVARHWWGNGGEQILLGTVILMGLGVLAAGLGFVIRLALGRH
jgi:hypothetical protein